MTVNDVVLWLMVAVIAFWFGQSRMIGPAPAPRDGPVVEVTGGALAAYRRWVLTFIVRCYSADEINGLAFDLGINYEQIPGDTISERAREFILHCERHGLIPQMLDALRIMRS